MVATAEGVLVKHTYNGDADLSGRVDVLDYFAIDAGKAQRRSGFASGDFDFSGGHANAVVADGQGPVGAVGTKGNRYSATATIWKGVL